MTTPPGTLDGLVVSYLDAVGQALTGLPEDRREELLADLRDHIAAERAALDSPSEAAVRAILDRLGDPATLAAEARLADDGPATPSPVAAPAGQSGRRRLRPSTWIMVAIGLILIIFALFGVAVTRSGVGRSGQVSVVPTSAPLPPTPR
jgi:uncharacterized membrane protein